MNEWEIIGRFVDLDNRLRTLEGRPTVQEKPQPVATGLCEAVEPLLKRCSDMAKNGDVCGCEQDHICGLPEFCREIDNVRHALTAERKRQEIRDRLIFQVDKRWMKSHLNDKQSDEELMEAVEEYRRRIATRDAFDKGAEK